MHYVKRENRRAAFRRWYASHTEEGRSHVYSRKTRIKEWYDARKAEFSCIRCGESHPACLEFHHLVAHRKIEGVGQLIKNGASIERIEKEIRKCIPLCANCHKKEHHALRTQGESLLENATSRDYGAAEIRTQVRRPRTACDTKLHYSPESEYV